MPKFAMHVSKADTSIDKSTQAPWPQALFELENEPASFPSFSTSTALTAFSSRTSVDQILPWQSPIETQPKPATVEPPDPVMMSQKPDHTNTRMNCLPENSWVLLVHSPLLARHGRHLLT